MRIPLIILLAACTLTAHAQSIPDCYTPRLTDSETQQSWTSQGADMLYMNASSLARVLARDGIHIQCIARAANQRHLPGETASVLFHADPGVFTIAFFPTPKQAADAIAQELQTTQQPAWHLVQFQDAVFEVDDPALSATLQKQYGDLVNSCHMPATTVPAWEDALGSIGWETGPADAIQTRARTLRADLESHSIHVLCIRTAKEGRMVPGQLNAALFKTDKGSFAVWFMQDTQSAAAAITLLASANAPRTLPSGSGQIFLQDRDLVFHISACCGSKEGSQLATTLRQAYPSL